jgi:hypothetical protein
MGAAAQQRRSMLEHALFWASKGMHVFPLFEIRPDGKCACGPTEECDKNKSAGKHPRIPRWQIFATDEEKQIREWWQRWPASNIGILCGTELPGGGYLMVVDVDPRHDGDVELALLEQRYGNLPETPRNLTGGNGWHVLLRARRAVPSRSGSLGKGVDVKCRGGYIVAPPSSHASGTPYTRDAGADIEDVPIAEAPEWALILADPPRAEAPKSAADAIIEGGRHNALVSIAGSMRRRGLSGHEILPSLQAVNEARCHPPLDDADVKRIAFSATWDAGDPVKGDDPWKLMSTAQIFAPLPPYPWLVPGLHLAPGRISLLNGYANAGKTVVAMSISLAVASGSSVWGVYAPAKTGKVLHLNGEIGSYLARERYQRLAKGHGIDLDALIASGNLALSNYPTCRLDDDEFETQLALACSGYQLVIIDSLRAFAGALDENAKEIGVALFKLARVSDATGVTILVLHHNRKTDDKNQGSVKEAIAGSSSIFGGSECAFVMEQKVKAGPIIVYHERSPIGRTLEDFGLLIEDVEKDGDRRWGLRVVHMEGAQMAELEKRARLAKEAVEGEAAATAILEVLKRYAGVYRGSRETFRDEARVGKGPFSMALNSLMAKGVVVEGGTYHKKEWALR